MINDCHLHTCFSGDSETPVRAQLNRALELGMTAVCITDHHDWDAADENGLATERFLLDFPNYLPALREIREEYRGKLDVGIGVELGLQLHTAENTEYVMKTFSGDMDFIIGSNHFVDHYDVYYPLWFTFGTEAERYRRFFEVSLKRVEAYDCFDSLGHLDFLVRYGPNKNRFYNYKAYADVISAILETLIRKDKALEVNTGGFKYGLGQPNPGLDILLRYRELGGKLLTVGSDAHVPGFIGYEFERTAELLKSIGFKEYAVYRRRVPELLPLM